MEASHHKVEHQLTWCLRKADQTEEIVSGLPRRQSFSNVQLLCGQVQKAILRFGELFRYFPVPQWI